MSQPVEIMLARWPQLYPGSTGYCQEGTGDDGQGEGHAAEVARVRSKVIAPILEAEDMAHVFVEMRVAYRDWTRSHPGPGGDLEVGDVPRGPQGRCLGQRPGWSP